MRVEVFLKDRLEPIVHPTAHSMFTTGKNKKKFCVTKLIDPDVRLVFEYPVSKVERVVRTF
jgi:hypothetical protein